MPVPGPGSDTLVSVRSAWSVHISEAIAMLAAETRATKAALWELNYQASWTFRCASGCSQTLGPPTVRVTRRDSHRVWYLFFLVWRCEVTVEAIMTVTCTPEPLPKPGKRGDLPPVPARNAPARNANLVIESDFTQPPTEILECGQRYDFEVMTSDYYVAHCEGYSFDTLYQAAVGYMDARVAELQCSPDCPDKHYYIRQQSGTCQGSVAVVSLAVSAVCLPRDAPREKGVALRIGGELRAPFSDRIEGAATAWRERLSVELRPRDDLAGCEKERSFWITLRARVDDCAAIHDFEPYVSRVQTQASTIWRAIDCRMPCRMWPFQELGAEWECKDGVVTVRYAFAAHCVYW